MDSTFNTNLSGNNQLQYFNYYFLFAYCLLIEYIIPYGIFSFAKLFFPLIFVLVALDLLKKNRIKLIDVIFLFSFAVVTTISFTYNSIISSVIIFIIYFLEKGDLKIKKSFEVSLILLSTLFLFFYIHPSPYAGRYMSNIPDPNMTGVMFLFVFFFLQKNKFYILSLFIIITGIFFSESRNFIMAIFIYILISMLKRNNIVYKMLSFLNVYKLFIMFGLLSVIITFAYLFYYKQVTFQDTQTRVLTITDSSNLLRFSINAYFLNYLVHHVGILFHGISNYSAFFMANAGRKIHNSYFSVIAKSGVLYSMFYFYFLSWILNKHYTYRNYEYIISFLFFSMFIMDCFESYFLILFWYSLRSETKMQRKNTIKLRFRL